MITVVYIPPEPVFAHLITAIGKQNGFVSETREIQLHRKSEIDFVSETGGIRGLHSAQLCRSGLDGVRSTQNSKTRMMGVRGACHVVLFARNHLDR